MAACTGALRRAQGGATPKALPCVCAEWAGGLTSCSRLTTQFLELNGAPILLMPDPRFLQGKAAMPPQPPKKSKKAWSIRGWGSSYGCSATHLWLSQNCPRSLDFRDMCTKVVLGIASLSTPPWVEAELATCTEVQLQCGDGFSVNGCPGAPGQDCNRMAGLKQRQMFVGHYTVDRCNTSTISTTFKRRPIEGINKNLTRTCGDVRILCKSGRLKEALHILNQGVSGVDSNTYVCLLQECINMKDLAGGKQVHAHILGSGLKPNIFVQNTLVNMYAKCGSLVEAHKVFDEMRERTLFTWSMMIGGYAKQGCGRAAFEIYEQMQREGVMPDRILYTCVLNACVSLGALEKGKQVHADFNKSGIAPDLILENILVDMYAKCGSMKDARQVFDNMAQRDVVSWNTMIAGYTQHECGREAFEIYEQMQCKGVAPNRVTFICVLNACASQGALEKGRDIHSDMIKSGVPSYINLETALVDMYAKCGSMKDAHGVFENMAKRNVVSWNAMISGYTQHGCGREALEMYEQMCQEAVTPDLVTFTCIVNACAGLGSLEKGKRVHADISKGRISPDVILDTALVDMYAKCGSMKDMHQVFNTMTERNVVSWSVVIAGYAQYGYHKEALEMFEQMQGEGLTPNMFTFTCILNVCASQGALEKGRQVHSDISKSGNVPDIILETALVNMYAKSGSMKDAHQVFNHMTQRDVVSWSAVIAGYAQHGCGRKVLKIYEQMQLEGVKPNCITFTALFSACSHLGLVDEGRHYFDSMTQDHGLTPSAEHFGCMVDLLGRAGRLDEAEDFINTMPIKPEAGVWNTLLGACRIHGNVELAERAAKCILKSEP